MGANGVPITLGRLFYFQNQSTNVSGLDALPQIYGGIMMVVLKCLPVGFRGGSKQCITCIRMSLSIPGLKHFYLCLSITCQKRYSASPRACAAVVSYPVTDSSEHTSTRILKMPLGPLLRPTRIPKSLESKPSDSSIAGFLPQPASPKLRINACQQFDRTLP